MTETQNEKHVTLDDLKLLRSHMGSLHAAPAEVLQRLMDCYSEQQDMISQMIATESQHMAQRADQADELLLVKANLTEWVKTFEPWGATPEAALFALWKDPRRQESETFSDERDCPCHEAPRLDCTPRDLHIEAGPLTVHIRLE